ncbi:hypothetical protein FACS1894172_07490 [Spirochaetia bacterium]|nr:hypothetical protein FACS1894164_02220 [Spirochaetia bacterium]GHU31867.1 hypothetical protein FACS1894172_07490 [Spirochaetia bacterium]
MKRLLWGAFFFISALNMSAQTLPRPDGFINDFAAVLTADDRLALEELTGILQEKTGAEIDVVTIKSFGFYGYGSIDEFAVALFNEWGIGRSGKDDGVLVVLAVEDRDVRIEVGYGLEGVLPDSVAGRILDNAVIPDFRENNFSAGLLKGAQAIASIIAAENGIDRDSLALPAVVSESSRPKSSEWIGLVVWCGIVFTVFIFAARKEGAKKGHSGGGTYRSSGGGSHSSGSHSSSHHSSSSHSGGHSGGGGASRHF